MKGIIDKINGNIITTELENGEILNIEYTNNNLNLKEGLCVNIINNIIIGIDYNHTMDRLFANSAKFEKLKNR